MVAEQKLAKHRYIGLICAKQKCDLPCFGLLGKYSQLQFIPQALHNLDHDFGHRILFLAGLMKTELFGTEFDVISNNIEMFCILFFQNIFFLFKVSVLCKTPWFPVKYPSGLTLISFVGAAVRYAILAKHNRLLSFNN